MSFDQKRSVITSGWTQGTNAFRVGFMACVLTTGCASRTLTIVQGELVNTAMYENQGKEGKTGEPLELNIVCVFPSDYARPGGDVLNPDMKITSNAWYEQGPPVGERAKFSVAAEQIYVLRDQWPGKPYGVKKGPSLRGRRHDGKRDIKVAGLQFREKKGWKEGGSLMAKEAVIYVFPKFIDKDGKVIAVAPVMFPPSARNMRVEIGVSDSTENKGQFIRRLD